MLQIQLPYAFKDLRKPLRHKAYYGGRGGAKSHSFAQELVLRGFQRREMRWLCCREIQKSVATSVKKLLEDKILAAGLGPSRDGGNDFYVITERSIKSHDGRVEFLFEGLRNNPESVKSMEGLDGAWVEEANVVSQRSIDLLIPTVRKEGSELWWSWNRRHANDPVDKMFLGNPEKPPRSVVQKVTWEDNPWFPEVLREEMEWCKKRDHDKWLHVWQGDLVRMSEARVFKNWEINDLDSLIEEDKGCVPRLGADWGYSIDPTVLVECFLLNNGGRKILYIRDERHKIKCPVDEIPSLFAGTDVDFPVEQRRWENKFGHRGIKSAYDGYKIVADSARPETIKHLRDRGFNIASAIKGARSIEEGISFIQGYDVVIHPNCKNTIDEFTYYSYKEDALTGEVLPELADRDNHVVDALRYALEGARRGRQPGSVRFAAPEIITA